MNTVPSNEAGRKRGWLLEKPGAETTPSFNFVTVFNDSLVT
jgi:hypothetical protein